MKTWKSKFQNTPLTMLQKIINHKMMLILKNCATAQFFLLHNFRFKIFEDLKVKRDLHYKKNFSVFQEYEFWHFLQQVDVQSLHLQD